VEILKVTNTWNPESDVYALYAELTPSMFVPEPVPGLPCVSLLIELDERERETGRVIGIEVVGFSLCTDWTRLPKLHELWQLDGAEPTALPTLLTREQARLTAQTVS
jgi:hypothetical protein